MRSILRALQPVTAGFPIPRATTAARLVIPPRAVSTPVAAIIPSTSSGLVSRRTSSTASPSAARSFASGREDYLPVAAPGEAGRPREDIEVGCRIYTRDGGVGRARQARRAEEPLPGR